MALEDFKSLNNLNWELVKFDQQLALEIYEEHKLPLFIANILASKNINSKDAINFLNPTVRNFLTDPFKQKDIEKAAKRIVQAIKSNEKIGIFGDYDVDGATSSSLLYRYIKQANPKQEIEIHIPDRESEGYGLNKFGLEKLNKNGATLLCSTDCGINSSDEADFCKKELKVDLIVMDHHEPDSELPNAYAIVNPKRHDNNGEYHYLAAVGVVFLICVCINKLLKDEGYFESTNLSHPDTAPDLISLLDIVALGTVCDSVPLIELNRAFVQTGLKVLERKTNVGINSLNKIAQNIRISTYALGFIIGPRINAGGRIADSSIGAKLLTCENPVIADNYAQTLDNLNTQRRELEKLIQEEALAQITEEILAKQFIFVHAKNWHKGIIGIVASRLKEKYNLPTFIATEIEEGIYNGSGRSAGDFDLGNIILKAKESGIIKEGGGHKMAAGFTFERKNESLFINFIESEIKKHLSTGKNFTKSIKISQIIDIKAVDLRFAENIESLAPFGIGNPEPKFAITNARLIKSTQLKGGIIKAYFSSDSGGSLEAILFNNFNEKTRENMLNETGKNFAIIGKISISEFNGRKTCQFIMEDIGIPVNSNT